MSATLCGQPIPDGAVRDQRPPIGISTCEACILKWVQLPMQDVLSLRQRPDGVAHIAGVWHVVST